MKIVILGAAGRTGSLLVEQALGAGHSVVAFIRAEESMTEQANVKVAVGDARSEADLTKAFTGQDAVISTLGSNKPNDDLIKISTQSLTSAAKAANVKRVIMMSSFLVSDNFQPKGIMRLFSGLMKMVVSDKSSGETLLKNSDLDWTIVYATPLSNGEATNTYRIVGSSEKVGVTNGISRANVADFLVKQLADPTYVRKTVLITDK